MQKGMAKVRCMVQAFQMMCVDWCYCACVEMLMVVCCPLPLPAFAFFGFPQNRSYIRPDCIIDLKQMLCIAHKAVTSWVLSLLVSACPICRQVLAWALHGQPSHRLLRNQEVPAYNSTRPCKASKDNLTADEIVYSPPPSWRYP